MKRIVICIVLLLTVFSINAETQKFSIFNVYVPQNWVSQAQENALTLLANDGSSSVVVITSDANNLSPKEIAAASAKRYGITNIVSDSNSTASFEYETDGVKTKVIVIIKNKIAAIISITSSNSANTNAINSIIASIL